MLLALVTAWFMVHHRPQSEVEAYKKFLIEHGEKLELAELVPPPVPAESNCADAVRSAFVMFGSGTKGVPNAMKMVVPGKAMVGWMQPEACSYDFTNAWEDFAARVAEDRPAIGLLHQALERPKLDFQFDYSKDVVSLLPHLTPMKQSAQKLASAAVLDLHNADTDDAATNICIILALVQRAMPEGLLISHMVRIAMANVAISPTWELLQSPNATDPQLAMLQNQWDRLDFFADATNVFALERVWSINEIERLRAAPDEIQKTFGSFASLTGSSSSSSSLWDWPPDWEAITEKPRSAIGAAMWRTSWSYSDELHELKSEQIILETLRVMRTNQNQCYKTSYDSMQKKLSLLSITNAGASFFRALKIPDFSEFDSMFSLGGAVNNTLRVEAARRVVVVAIALKRFQLRHGVWPETLDKLAPEFLAFMPIDPYDGKPLRYHPNADGTFLLYCVGEDGVDDGGDPTNAVTGSASSSLYWQNVKARDWVWPQPATEAEVKFFYDNPPK